jgi:hypothetical protein
MRWVAVGCAAVVAVSCATPPADAPPSVARALAAAPAVAEPSPAYSAAYAVAEALFAAGIGRGGQYMKSGGICSAATWPGYEGLPVERCVYQSMGRTSAFYLLAPTAEQLASWTAAACSQDGVADSEGCARRIYANIWNANNAQFPVAGVVIEPASVLCARDSVEVCGRTLSCTDGEAAGVAMNFVFRDGVTARTASMASTAQEAYCEDLTEEAIEAIAQEPATRALRWARVANVCRGQYRAGGGSADVEGLAFLDASRTSMRRAYETGRYDLLDAWVMGRDADC